MCPNETHTPHGSVLWLFDTDRGVAGIPSTPPDLSSLFNEAQANHVGCADIKKDLYSPFVWGVIVSVDAGKFSLLLRLAVGPEKYSVIVVGPNYTLRFKYD